MAVPVNPNGGFVEVGASGTKTWGLTRVAAGIWQINPSIDVVGDKRPDGTIGPSPWHQTPRIVGVPESERWITEPP